MKRKNKKKKQETMNTQKKSQTKGRLKIDSQLKRWMDEWIHVHNACEFTRRGRRKALLKLLVWLDKAQLATYIA